MAVASFPLLMCAARNVKARLPGEHQHVAQRGKDPDNKASRWSALTMFDPADLVSDTMRGFERRYAPFLEASDISLNPSLILGGQFRGEGQRLFRIYAAGKYLEVGVDTHYIQTGEIKCGKQLIGEERDSLEIRMRRRFAQGDTFFTSLHQNWSEGAHRLFRELPELVW